MKMDSVKITHFFDVIKKEPGFEYQSDVSAVVLDTNDIKQEYHYKEELDVAWDERDNNYDVNRENHNFANSLSQKLGYPIVVIERLSDTLVNKHFVTVKTENGCESIVTPKVQKKSYTQYYRKFCPNCNQTPSSQKKSKDCKTCGTRWIYECQKCNKQLFTYKGIVKHLSTKCIAKGIYYACFKCNYKSAIRYKVNEHLKNIHLIRDSLNRIEEFESENIQNDVARELHECSKCEKKFDKLPSLLRHVQICGQAKYNDQIENFASLVNAVQDKCLHYCTTCKQTVENDKVGSFHQKKCENCNSKFSFKCKTCHQIFQSYSTMNSHMKLKHTIGENVFKCPECDYQTPSIGYLTRHVNRKHIINTIVCPKCGRKYKNSSAFKKHSQTCKIEPKFQCEFCSHRSKSKSNLKMHVLNVHTEGNEIGCPQCNIILKNKSCLYVHLSYCKKKPHLHCNSCPFKTKYRSDLKSHYENVHSNALKKEACPRCSKEFKNKNSLRSHLIRCGKFPESSCNYCLRFFKGKQTLINHIIRVHSNDNNINVACHFPYLHCDDCLYKTKFKGDLTKHVLIHLHGGTEECPKCKKYFKSGYLKRHTANCGKKFLRCDHCDFQTLVKECLKRHILNMHSPGNEINCPRCGRICKNKMYLRVHLQRCGTDPHLQCDHCPYKTKSKYDLKNHVEKKHTKKRRIAQS